MLIWNHRISLQWQPFCQRCSINKSWGIAGALSIWLPLIRTYWGLLDNSLTGLKAGGGHNIFWGNPAKKDPKPNLISPPKHIRAKTVLLINPVEVEVVGWGHHAARVMICLKHDFIPGETRWLHSAMTYDQWACTFTVQQSSLIQSFVYFYNNFWSCYMTATLNMVYLCTAPPWPCHFVLKEICKAGTTSIFRVRDTDCFLFFTPQVSSDRQGCHMGDDGAKHDKLMYAIG